MSTSTALVFPHQLFEDNPLLKGTKKVFLIEDELYFGQYPFHKKKLLLHRASMRYYEDFLQNKKLEVRYLSYADYPKLEKVFQLLSEEKIEAIKYIDTTDYLLERRISRFSKKYDIKTEKLATPLFLTPLDTLDEILTKTKGGSYLMANFYKKQRQRLDILVQSDGSPVGDKWSFDDENRKPLPKKISIPKFRKIKENKYVKVYRDSIEKEFSDNYGTLDSFNYPTTHQEAQKVLEDFLEERFHLFGDYEDAISGKEKILFHSVLTPALNVGLLTPHQILDTVMDYASQNDIPINSLEGFVRQLIGWREFMRGIYEKEGVFERTNNFFGFERKIPESFYTGETGIVPIDNTIKSLLESAYCHHIERLMILGNFMLLCEFDPDAIYQWFMELFIDAYDWVMVPNVYGMTQYADGGLITTKPYVSGSNYILKMSDYKKGDWATTWNGLYWRFIHQHRELFAQNHRMRMMVSMLDRMKKSTLKNHLEVADEFLESL